MKNVNKNFTHVLVREDLCTKRLMRQLVCFIIKVSKPNARQRVERRHAKLDRYPISQLFSGVVQSGFVKNVISVFYH